MVGQVSRHRIHRLGCRGGDRELAVPHLTGSGPCPQLSLRSGCCKQTVDFVLGTLCSLIDLLPSQSSALI